MRSWSDQARGGAIGGPGMAPGREMEGGVAELGFSGHIWRQRRDGGVAPRFLVRWLHHCHDLVTMVGIA